MVPWDFGKTSVKEQSEKFKHGTMWVMSKIVFERTQARWLGSSKKLLVNLVKTTIFSKQ